MATTSVWVEELPSGKYRVRWRNPARVSTDGRELKPKDGVTVEDRPTRDRLVARVREALALDHYYLHEPSGPQSVSNFERAAQDFIRYSAANGASSGTVQVLISALRRVCRDIRRIERIADGAPIPVSKLRIPLVTRLKADWGTTDSPRRVYDLSLHLLGAWRWIASQPEEYPSTPMPPLTASLVLPPAPPRVRAPEPTVAELDAICRRAAVAAAKDLKSIVATMRLTGLRVGQVLAVCVRDVDLGRRTLTVATGKSRREKATMREVPLHDGLLAVLRGRVVGGSPEDLLFPPRPGAARRTPPDAVMRRLWAEATAVGEVREQVWKPRNRHIARPDHAFRAGFLVALREAGVDADVRHALVGHAEGSTEERHYSGVTLARMRTAIDALPGIDWIGPV